MPGTTPVYGFPYPQPTDLVADYPALGQDLAEDIENHLSTNFPITAWTSFTPTLGRGSWAIGNGTLTGQKIQFGKVVHFRAQMAFGSTTVTDATLAPRISGPVNPKVTIEFANVVGFGYDLSAGALYTLYPLPDSLGFQIYTQWDAAGVNGRIEAVINTKPVTWANGDQIRIAGSYEVA